MTMLQRLLRRAADERGALRPVQYVLIAIGIAILYMLIVFFPSLTHQMAVHQIADEEAARMNMNSNDEQIRKETLDKLNQVGIHTSPANITLERRAQPYILNKITITYDDEVEHLWGSRQSLHKKVTASARMGESAAKL